MNTTAWRREAQAHPFAPQPHHPGVSELDTPLDDATHVIWQDPSSYDPLFHGPPYLPGMKVRMDRNASVIKSRIGSVDLSPGSELPGLLAFLRALAWVHQTHHWLTCGGDYYGDHLLFERLYDGTVAEIDQVAEKAIGLGVPSTCLQPMAQAGAMVQFLRSFKPGSCPFEYASSSLQAERDFLDCTKSLVEILKNRGALSRGLDNLIAGIEDKHEGHVYLLGQRTKDDPWKAQGA